jgi:hypothetical protein
VSKASPIRGRASIAAVGGFALTGVLLGVVLARVIATGWDPANTSAPGYLPLAYLAAVVLAVVFVLAAFVQRIDLTMAGPFPWLVGGVSFVVSFIPFFALVNGATDLGTRIYAGLHVPKGTVQFWDLTLVLKSIDCASWGFDVFAPNNGCLKDPAIYGPGMLWLQYVPLRLFSEKHVIWLGVLAMAISSLLLVWLARRTAGIGQVVLLAAAVGGPWLLLLERGNIDAVLLWGAAVVVILVSRWNRLWAWSAAAVLIWLLGTWKYYPFAMGLMLVPVLRLRRGWIVLSGYGLATVAFMVATWSNFQFSSQSNSHMIDYGDTVVLGRVPVVARMIGTVVGAKGLQANDFLFFALAAAALAWGVAVGMSMKGTHRHPSMLAIAGSSLFLVSVLVAGFGYGYKATFLLLCIPLVASITRSPRASMVSSGIAILALIAISSLVVWNTVMATSAGTIAASFSFGVAAVLIARALRPASPARA